MPSKFLPSWPTSRSTKNGGWKADRWIRRLQQVEGEHGLWWRFFLARRHLAVPNNHPRKRSLDCTTNCINCVRGGQAPRCCGACWPSRKAIRTWRSKRTSTRFDPATVSRTSTSDWSARSTELADSRSKRLAAPASTTTAINARLLDLAWSAAMQRDQAEWAERLRPRQFRRHQNDPTAKIWLAQVLATRGKTSEVNDLLSRPLADQSTNVGDWMGLLSFYLQIGDNEKALASLGNDGAADGP